MPRRKTAYLSDGSDSDASQSEGSEGGFNSQEDADSKAERALFEHNGRKRRRGGGGGKAAAWEGVFGDEEDEGRAGGGGLGSRRSGNKQKARTDWTKYVHFTPSNITDHTRCRAPAFVTPSATTQEGNVEDITVDQDGEDGSASSESSESDGNQDLVEEERRASPRVRETDYDEESPRAGMGLGAKPRFSFDTTSDVNDILSPATGAGRGGIGSMSRGRGGIGSNRRDLPTETAPVAHGQSGGIGSSNAPPKPLAESSPSTPSAFGRQNTRSATPEVRPRQAFQGVEKPPSVAKAAQLTAAEMSHFRNIEGTFGARFMANFGWKAGEGLGKNKDGRAIPVQAGKIMRGQGIKSGIRTEDSKREAKRRGEVVSDDDDEDVRPARRGRGHAGPSRETQKDQSWRKQRKVKVKVEHKSYEQLLADAGDANAAGIGLVLDARGGDLKEVQSLSSLSLSTWTPTSDKLQLPELRHNLRLIVDVSKGDVDALVKEGRTVTERRRWALREEQIAQNKIVDTERRIERIQKIQATTAAISRIAAEQATLSDPSLSSLTEHFETLLAFPEEYAAFGLDEVIVGSIAQVLRKAFLDWHPFDVSSDILLSSLKTWRKAYNLPRREGDAAMTTSGAGLNSEHVDGERGMTAWESLLWSLWLPKVRSAINNEWSTAAAHAPVHLLEAWDPILPPFIRDNVLDQLVLPKVKSAIEDWKGRPSSSGKTPSLAGVVFPWLPLLGARVEDVLEGAKRRIRRVLQTWVPKDQVPSELERWRNDIYSAKDWDKLMLDWVVPKLGAALRDDLRINPRSQDMTPLKVWVLPWQGLIRSSTFSRLLEENFFQKWLDTLHFWLVQPNYEPDEVANWFEWWKEQFPAPLRETDGIRNGFNQGIELMGQAVHLGADASTRLKKPVFIPSKPHTSKARPTPSRKLPAPSDPVDITLRSLAEDFAAQNDLIFLPLGRSHPDSGKQLFKVSKNVDGRRGITVYITDEAVFALDEDGSYRAVSLDDMVKRALM
ncbi:GC-rich sequence DNA-binding factor-like protein-domain-containing protein [Naematelia encephala]|uniref:GC-rich sequence DNA-binding factor-like protein-domain-containing protein n=1 Tax=Naematelia encephala TaxID=71784 RepID=A0A1Y2AVK9_9TREE|nr:GC-rich sequence DNA-binding factor-like protein-domain-containing protein [Naematelia encephala]